MLLCPLFAEGKELVLVVVVHLACRGSHALVVDGAHGFRGRAWLYVDDEHGIAHLVVEVGVYVVCSLLTEVIHDLVVDIYLILVS